MRSAFPLISGFLASLLLGQSLAQSSTAPPMAPQWFSYSSNWQLPEDYFVRAKMPMVLVHPRPDSETSSWARHRKAYPGIQYRIPISLQGGAYPFHYEILEGPDWLRIGETVWDDEYAILHGTPPMDQDGKPAQVVRVRIHGQEHGRDRSDTIGPTFVDAEFTIRVTSSTGDFVFVDGSVAQSGDGSFNSPLKTVAELFQNPDLTKRTSGGFPYRAVYIKPGTYDIVHHYWPNNGSHHLNVDVHPRVYLGIPGQAKPTIDFTNAKLNSISSDSFWGGIHFANMPQKAYWPARDTAGTPNMLVITGSRGTLFENRVTGLRPAWVSFDPYQDAGYEYVSPNTFKVAGVDATAAFLYNSPSFNSHRNALRVYRQGEENADATGHYWQGFPAANATFDGTDTYVTLDGDGVPEDISNVRVLWRGGIAGGFYMPSSTSHRRYWTFWGNHIQNVERNNLNNSQPAGFGAFYSLGWSVMENNLFTNDASHIGEFYHGKSSIAFMSYRRNVKNAVSGGRWRQEGYTTGAHRNETTAALRPENGWPSEFCYNVMVVTGSDETVWAPKEKSSRGEMGMEDISIYRNTIIGGTSHTTSDSHFYVDGNLYFTGSTRWSEMVSGSMHIVNDEGGSYAQYPDYLDEEYRLKGDYRRQLLGRFGHEIGNGVD